LSWCKGSRKINKSLQLRDIGTEYQPAREPPIPYFAKLKGPEMARKSPSGAPAWHMTVMELGLYDSINRAILAAENRLRHKLFGCDSAMKDVADMEGQVSWRKAT
jgi:hypothetical protein